MPTVAVLRWSSCCTAQGWSASQNVSVGEITPTKGVGTTVLAAHDVSFVHSFTISLFRCAAGAFNPGAVEGTG